MTMKLMQLPLHLTPEQALTVIEVLDLLQQLLWNHYGEAIRAQLLPSDTPSETDLDDPPLL